MTKKHITSYIIFTLFFFTGIYGQEKTPNTDSLSAIRVGVKVSPPFLFKKDTDQLKGISAWLWEQIASEMGRSFDYQELSLSEVLRQLQSKDLDIAINPLTVTSDRIERIGFTQPFFVSSSAIATRSSSSWESAAAFVKKFFSANFIKAIFVLFIVIFIFGFIAWLFERKANPDEFPDGWAGMWEGIWWSAVTMTTVGYGDKSPRSLGGRVVALVWMFTAIIIISSLTASIASSLTVNQLSSDIESLQELRQYEVGSVASSASLQFLEDNYVPAQPYQNIQEGLDALEEGEIDAFVYDEPILRYEILSSNRKALQVLPYRFNTQYYSFGLPKGSPLADQINPIMLRILESSRWQAILSEYDLKEK
ncbi:MAG: transporter substrate-binding domain-containing protein [Phaeodactylibacter sp.]|uniref:transporter substrate-binding domain-containing protein n=1 Tax=Phaeodactylibacter sp. TaxID=1940289 RepID=UPI0032EF3149